MLNINNSNNKDFDLNLYKFEKKKQTIDNKQKEKEGNKKIQINFTNSFVNEKIQHKYDKIIEINNKRNKERENKVKIKKWMSFYYIDLFFYFN